MLEYRRAGSSPVFHHSIVSSFPFPDLIVAVRPLWVLTCQEIPLELDTGNEREATKTVLRARTGSRLNLNAKRRMNERHCTMRTREMTWYSAIMIAVLVVAGDVSVDEVRKLAEDTYGVIPARPGAVP